MMMENQDNMDFLQSSSISPYIDFSKLINF